MDRLESSYKGIDRTRARLSRDEATTSRDHDEIDRQTTGSEAVGSDAER